MIQNDEEMFSYYLKLMQMLTRVYESSANIFKLDDIAKEFIKLPDEGKRAFAKLANDLIACSHFIDFFESKGGMEYVSKHKN